MTNGFDAFPVSALFLALGIFLLILYVIMKMTHHKEPIKLEKIHPTPEMKKKLDELDGWELSVMHALLEAGGQAFFDDIRQWLTAPKKELLVTTGKLKKKGFIETRQKGKVLKLSLSPEFLGV